MDERIRRQGSDQRRSLRLTPVLLPLCAIAAAYGLSRFSPGPDPRVSPMGAASPPAPAMLLPTSGEGARAVIATSDQSEAGAIALASHEAPKPDAAATTVDPDAQLRKRVVGHWQDEFHGKRNLTVRSDGTATMVVEPSGIGRKLFAERLEFEIEWILTDGRIAMTTTGGTPHRKAELVLKLYGREAEYKILNLDDDQFLLLDADGKTEYDWRRTRAGTQEQ